MSPQASNGRFAVSSAQTQLFTSAAIIMYIVTMVWLLSSGDTPVAMFVGAVLLGVRILFVPYAKHGRKVKQPDAGQLKVPIVKNGIKVNEARPHVIRRFQRDPKTGEFNEVIVRVIRRSEAKIVLELILVLVAGMVAVAVSFAFAGSSSSYGFTMLVAASAGLVATDRVVLWRGTVIVLTDFKLMMLCYFPEWVVWRRDSSRDMQLRDVSYKDPKEGRLARLLHKTWGTLGQDSNADQDVGLRKIGWVPDVVEIYGLINSQQAALGKSS